ncbi:MAG: TetR/AcrR family transcriptional regulator [bacterium]|jgi:TetR/AcrR family transcriptional regulator
MVKSNPTEEHIIAAAKEVFVRKGYDGARMQEIADEAEINKALLHYYFRSKDKLFEKVFEMVFREVFNTLATSLFTVDDFEEFLESLVYNYTETLKNKPYLPQFILHELNRNPDRMVELLQESQFDREKLFELIRKAEQQGVLVYHHPIHLITNILSLCVFPFIAKPIIKGFMLQGDEESFRKYIDERPEHILQFVRASIKNEKGKSL